MRLEEGLEGSDFECSAERSDRFGRYHFVVSRGGEVWGRGTHFTGALHIRPWVEFHPVRDTSSWEGYGELFDALASVLEPGSHMMVHYLEDEVTARGLTENVPPAATPLGFLMWNSGFRWFKDWYFTEGWMEGDQKLQGNLPVSEEVKREREREMREALESFINDEVKLEECEGLAREVLEEL